VNRLSEHGGRAGQRERHELGERDAQVGPEGREDRSPARAAPATA
jgi:hypothetical protein